MFYLVMISDEIEIKEVPSVQKLIIFTAWKPQETWPRSKNDHFLHCLDFLF